MSCLKILLFSSIILACNVSVYTLLILTLLLLLTVQFFGIADVLSTHLFNVPCAYAFQRSDFLDAAVPPRTPSLSEYCSLIVQFFLFDLGSTPQPLASLF